MGYKSYDIFCFIKRAAEESCSEEPAKKKKKKNLDTAESESGFSWNKWVPAITVGAGIGGISLMTLARAGRGVARGVVRSHSSNQGLSQERKDAFQQQQQERMEQNQRKYQELKAKSPFRRPSSQP